jgi:valyl-tRNA synthetase
MILASLKLLYKSHKKLKNIIPFKNVYFTGIIRDNSGRKLSKSLGNSPKLLNFLNKHSLDNIRCSMLLNLRASRDFILKDDVSESGKHFITKTVSLLKYCIVSNLNINLMMYNSIISTYSGVYRYFSTVTLDSEDNDIILNLILCIRQYNH